MKPMISKVGLRQWPTDSRAFNKLYYLITDWLYLHKKSDVISKGVGPLSSDRGIQKNDRMPSNIRVI